MFVDLPQSADPAALPKLVQHQNIGGGLAIGQVGKATPGPLLGQQAHQVVERVDRRKHAQEVDAIQLCRTQLLASAAPTMARRQLVDEGVGDIRREQFQKLRGPGRGQFRIHGPGGYPKETVASRLFGSLSFFNDKQLAHNCLCRIP